MSKVGENDLWRDVRELKKDRILQEAANLFYERGYAQTSVEAIAERFNATKPFVYYHYPSKIDLLVEICTRASADALQAVEEGMAREGDIAHRFRAVVRGFSLVALRNHRFVSIYYREQGTLPPAVAGETREMRKTIERHLCSLLEEGAASGAFAVPDTLITSARVILGMASFAFAWYRHHDDAELQQVATQIEQMASKLVAPTAA